MRPAALLIALALAPAGLAACGGDEEQPASQRVPSPPAASSPGAEPASTPAEAATGTASEPQATAGATEQAETTTTRDPLDKSPEGGAGDEAGNRVPAEFTFGDDGAQPRTVSVPAYLAIELTLRNAGPAQEVVIRTKGAQYVALQQAGTKTLTLEGLPPGRYTVEPERGEPGTIVVGTEGGP